MPPLLPHPFPWEPVLGLVGLLVLWVVLDHYFAP